MKTTKLNEYSQRIQELEVKVEHKNNLNDLLKQENDRLRLSNGKLGNEILELKSKCLGMSDAARELQS